MNEDGTSDESSAAVVGEVPLRAWTCNVCTKRNSATTSKCIVCGRQYNSVSVRVRSFAKIKIKDEAAKMRRARLEKAAARVALNPILREQEEADRQRAIAKARRKKRISHALLPNLEEDLETLNLAWGIMPQGPWAVQPRLDTSKTRFFLNYNSMCKSAE